jgi:hypothetical protein
MTQEEFRKLPWLMFNGQVLEAAGYSRNTLRKMVDCGVIEEVRPPGCTQRRYRKAQLAKLLGIDIATDVSAFRKEPFLLSEKAASGWTGYTTDVLQAIARRGGIVVVRPAGLSNARYRKSEIAGLIGFKGFL